MALAGGSFVAANWKGFLGRFGHRDREEEMTGPRCVVIGLGNPGRIYKDTRHNVGFDVIASLAAHLGVEAKKRKFGARIGEAHVGDRQLLLVKPQEFMNRSGQSVAAIVGFYKLPLTQLLVVADDLALEPGRIRLRPKGSAGGHNGLADIIEKVKSQEFARLRIGIGSSGTEDMAEYVLSRPTGSERQALDEAIETARDAVLCWMSEGVEAAMNRFNRKGSVTPADEKTGDAENQE